MSDKNINNSVENTQKQKEILPRKRLIKKNNQLIVTACLFVFTILFLTGWKMFFDQSPLGAWHMTMESDYIETIDAAEDIQTSDTAASNATARYEFLKDGVCRVTLGSITAEGTFDLASTEEYGNVISVAVSYDASPILYGVYKYNIRGNVLTGKQIVLENAYVENDIMTLDKGKGKDPLKPFDDPVLDDKLIGTWYDTQNDISYKFTKKGEMYRIMSGTLSIKHYYTILGDNMFVARYYSESEQTDTYTYYFDDKGNLYIDDYLMNKINE